MPQLWLRLELRRISVVRSDAAVWGIDDHMSMNAIDEILSRHTVRCIRWALDGGLGCTYGASDLGKPAITLDYVAALADRLKACSEKQYK